MIRTVLLILLIPALAWAEPLQTEPNQNQLIINGVMKISGKLRDLNDYMVTTQQKSLLTTRQESSHFLNDCMPSLQNYSFRKSLHITQKAEGEIWHFNCARSRDENQSLDSQFIATLNPQGELVDFQSMRVNLDTSNLPSMDLQEGTEVLAAVTVGTLASGALASYIYPNQKDKLQHAVAGSLAASSAAVVAYYGFGVSKNKALTIGVITGFVIGLLKEAYDSKHRDRHTVDSHDAIATGIGGGVGAFFLRIKFEF